MVFTSHYSGSKGNLYSVRGFAEEILLIDPGVSLKRIVKAMHYSLGEVIGALVSHSHADHCQGVVDLISRGIDCYATTETWQAIIGDEYHHRAHHIKSDMTPFSIGNFYGVAFPTAHDCPGSAGFFLSDGIDRLLYLIDAPFSHPRFAGMNIAAIEANWSEETMSPDLHPTAARRIKRSHMSVDRAIDLLKANDISTLREIHLLHLSDGNSNAEVFQTKVERATGKMTFVA
jgi:phosphoribosyl 1,2-cyclic phosphodiesterase